MNTGFLPRAVTVGGTSYRYQIYVPDDFDPGRRWPVVLSLHGSGEAGTDGVRQTTIGFGDAVRRAGGRFPAVVVFPQAHPPIGEWNRAMLRVAMRALDQTMAEWNGDDARVYLTGISMGGNGAWHAALAHPRRFAALVPVCGWVRVPRLLRRLRLLPRALIYRAAARRLRHLPTWVFHGAEDRVVPVAGSRVMVEAMRAAGARELRYTEYPNEGHISWDPAYAEPELVPWMLAQRR